MDIKVTHCDHRNQNLKCANKDIFNMHLFDNFVINVINK